jgi:hypothetical protein
LTQVCPPGWELPAAFLESLRQRGQMERVSVTHDLAAGAAGAGVVYTDGWPRSTREPGVPFSCHCRDIESTADESVLGCVLGKARSHSSSPCPASAGRDPLTVWRATAGTVGIGRALARWARGPLHVVKVALRALTTRRNADDAWLESPCHQPVAIRPDAGSRPLARP